MGKKWEYKYEDFKNDILEYAAGGKDKYISGALHNLGQEGWQGYSVVHYVDVDRYYFKREIEEPFNFQERTIAALEYYGLRGFAQQLKESEQKEDELHEYKDVVIPSSKNDAIFDSMEEQGWKACKIVLRENLSRTVRFKKLKEPEEEKLTAIHSTGLCKPGEVKEEHTGQTCHRDGDMVHCYCGACEISDYLGARTVKITRYDK